LRFPTLQQFPDERLIARLLAGLVVPIAPPGLATRTALLKRFADLLGMRLTAPASLAMAKELPIYKEVNGIRHILVDGEYIPDVIKPVKGYIWGKYQTARAKFLLNHRRDIFFRLEMSGKLMEHMEWIEDEASDMIHNIMEQMLKEEPIPESLKNTDTLRWVGLMNNYRYSAEEIVMRDLVYPEGLIEEMEEVMQEVPDINPSDIFKDFHWKENQKK
jgi:hypothetical protein